MVIFIEDTTITSEELSRLRTYLNDTGLGIVVVVIATNDVKIVMRGE